MQEIIKAIEKIAVKIADELKWADFGYANSTNSTGDTQLKLDVKTDRIIADELSRVSSVKSLISEEKEAPVTLNENSSFIVAYDPLDGSSLVDVNFAVGSIFGIYENELKPNHLVAGVYVIYGPRIEMVVCKEAVQLFRLNKDGQFKFIRNLILQEKGKINATGGTQKHWSKMHSKLIKTLFDEGYRLRYSGAMVSDLHQILLKGGGLFSYPATTDAPKGKLRVTFEVLPFALIYERAGGATTNGLNKTLFDIVLDSIHKTTPCFFGSKYEINKVLEVFND